MSWHGDKGTLDFFDAKGVVEGLLNVLRLKGSFDIGDDDALFPGRRASIIVEGDKVGVLGELHAGVAQAFELSGSVYVLEVDLEKLLTSVAGTNEYQAIPRFPFVTRDIALVVDGQVPFRKVEEIIRTLPLVRQVTLFDLYRGEQIPEGKKSFAVRIIYQSPDHTLTDEEVDQRQEQMLDRLYQELGAALRRLS